MPAGRPVVYTIETHPEESRQIWQRLDQGGPESLRALGRRLGIDPKLFKRIADDYRKDTQKKAPPES